MILGSSSLGTRMSLVLHWGRDVSLDVNALLYTFVKSFVVNRQDLDLTQTVFLSWFPESCFLVLIGFSSYESI